MRGTFTGDGDQLTISYPAMLSRIGDGRYNHQDASRQSTATCRRVNTRRRHQVSLFPLSPPFWPLPVFGLLFSFLGFAAVLSTGDPERLKNPGTFYVILFFLVLLPFGTTYLSARRQYATLRYLREPMRYHFASDQIRLEGSNFSSEMTWPLVQGVYETKRAFLIYQTAQSAWILPKRFFWGEDDEIERWRRFVTRHLTKPKLFRRPELLGAWF